MKKKLDFAFELFFCRNSKLKFQSKTIFMFDFMTRLSFYKNCKKWKN